MNLGELEKVWGVEKCLQNLARKLEGRKLSNICKSNNEKFFEKVSVD
jgi:hypothetical protein